MDNSIDEALLLAICALGCRFSPDSEARSLMGQLARRSQYLFYRNMEVVTVEALQTCVLLANLYSAECQFNSETILYGTSALRTKQAFELWAHSQQALQFAWSIC